MPDVFTVFLNKDDDDDDEILGAVFPLPIVPRVLSFSSLQHPPPPTPPPPPNLTTQSGLCRGEGSLSRRVTTNQIFGI